MSAVTATRRGRAGSIAVTVFASAFLAIALYQFSGVCQDWARALAFRYELDYGEGIVWQQALLMFGPRAYSPSTALPFIVFHYPPLYHVAVRALMLSGLDPLLAGRLISIASSSVSAICIVVLVLSGLRGERRPEHVMLAVAIGLLFLCLNPVRRWGMFMRVDPLAIALGFVGTVIFVRSRGGMTGLIAALLTCVAAMFTKQTQLPAGVSVFVVAMLCAPRRAIVASLVAGGAGLLALAGLQLGTGGFLQNIVGYNVNPIDLSYASSILRNEREAAALVALMLIGSLKVAQVLRRHHLWSELRRFDRATVTQAVMTVHFVLACLAVVQIVKEGSSTNYLIDMLGSGCVVIGFVVCGLGEVPALICTAIVILGLTTSRLRHEVLAPTWLAAQTAGKRALVELVAAQTKPVASDDMVLLLRAGKSVVFEPAIVNALVAGHRWDPSELLSMIRDHGFAFALSDDEPKQDLPTVEVALRAAYPRAEPTPSGMTIRYPP